MIKPQSETHQNPINKTVIIPRAGNQTRMMKLLFVQSVFMILVLCIMQNKAERLTKPRGKRESSRLPFKPITNAFHKPNVLASSPLPSSELAFQVESTSPACSHPCLHFRFRQAASHRRQTSQRKQHLPRWHQLRHRDGRVA